MYQETLKYYHLWRLAVQERDEARQLLKHSLADLSQLQELVNTLLLSEDQKPLLYNLETTEVTIDHQNCNYNHFSGDSTSPFSSNVTVSSSPAISGSECYNFPSNQMGFVAEKKIDFESVVLEAIGGVLPQTGKFLEVVCKANASVESVFITAPVPKWRNPPVQLSTQRQVFNDGITGNWNNGGLEFGSGILNRSFLGKMSLAK